MGYTSRRERRRGGGGGQVDKLVRALVGTLEVAKPKITNGGAAFRGLHDSLKAGPMASASGGAVFGQALANELLGQVTDAMEGHLTSHPAYKVGFAAGQTFMHACMNPATRSLAGELLQSMDEFWERTNTFTGQTAAGSSMVEEAGSALETVTNLFG